MMLLGNWYACNDESFQLPSNNNVVIEAFSIHDYLPSSQIGEKIAHIMHDILAVVDPELSRHLERLEILPEAFGV